MIISVNVKIIFVLFKYLIFLLRFVCVDNINNIVMIVIIINWVVNEFGIDVK